MLDFLLDIIFAVLAVLVAGYFVLIILIAIVLFFRWVFSLIV